MLLLRCITTQAREQKRRVFKTTRRGTDTHENAFGSQFALVLQGCPLSSIWCFRTGHRLHGAVFWSSVGTSYHPARRQSRAISLNSRKLPKCDLRPLNAAEIHRSEEHTSELQSRPHLVCRLLLE